MKRSRIELFAAAVTVFVSIGVVACGAASDGNGEGLPRTGTSDPLAALSSEADNPPANLAARAQPTDAAVDRADIQMPTIDPEHDGRGEGWEGEDTVEYMGVDDTWDADREGARLILSYDVTAGAFTGEIGNTGRSMLCAVRVAVVLEGGTELGPTSGTSLTPGQSSSIHLPAGGRPVEAWTARPQVSSC